MTEPKNPSDIVANLLSKMDSLAEEVRKEINGTESFGEISMIIEMGNNTKITTRRFVSGTPKE